MDAAAGKPHSFWLILALGMLLFWLYPFAARVLVDTGGMERTTGWAAGRDPDGRLRVVQVAADGPAAGTLRVGDEPLSINGYGPLSRGLGWVLFVDLRSGDRYTVQVVRGAATLEFSLPMTERPNAPKLWLLQVPLLLVSFVFYVTGLGVGLLGARDRVARLYALVAFAVAALLIPGGVFIGEAQYGRGRVVLSMVAIFTPFVLPLIYQFYAEFPPGIPRTRAWGRVTLLLYAWAALLFPLTLLTHLFLSQGAAAAATFIHTHATLFMLEDRIGMFYLPTALIAIVAVIVRNHRAVVDPDQRRRLRWAFWGSVVAAAPITALFLFDTLSTTMLGRETEYWRWLRAQTIAELFLVSLPVTFTYAVLAHRVLGVEVVVRRGLRYLLAKNVLRAAIFLPVVLLVLHVMSNPDRTVGQILFERPLFAFLAVVGGLGLYGRDRLGHWVDRKFFREAYDREQVLLDLIDEIKCHESLDDLARLVSQRIDAALHPHNVHLFFLDPGGVGLRLAHSSQEPAAGEPLAAEAALVRLMDDRAVALDVPCPATSLPEREAAWLESLGVRLAVPIGGGEKRLAGVLLLGEKKSEEPYSREDRRLLEAVASQIAIVYENASLRRATMHDAKVKHEVLARVDARGVNLLKECPVCGRCYDRIEDICADDRTTLTFSLPMDRTIDGKYRLDQLVGRGGMGAVYVATHLGLGRTVAVKLLKGSRFGNEEARRRFDREARASARLRHPNIITVYDYGSVGSEVAYLVMERLTGATLREEIQRSGSITPAVAARWFDQILEGVKFAHASGVIHRDLKPENVFLTRDARDEMLLKVLDFGLAKLRLPDVVTEPGSLTEAGAVVGTLTYMSPEQLSGRPVDERTDLFALGVMVLETLTGRNPFQRADLSGIVAAILHEPVGLAGDAQEIRELDAVLQRCLAKDRQARFSNASEMQAALLPALAACPAFGGAGHVDGNVETTEPPYQ